MKNIPFKNSSIVVITILFFVCGCKNETDKKNEAVAAPIVPKTLVVNSSISDAEIHYTVEGQGNHALLLVHGWSCDQTYWKHQVPYFKDNYKVVTIDLGGHGKSGTNRTDWTIASFGTDVLDVINTLEFEKLSIVGHSLGAMVVVDVASKTEKDINALVCVDYLVDPLTPLPVDVAHQMVAPFQTDFVNSTKGFVSTLFLPSSDSTLVRDIIADMSGARSEIAIPAMIDLGTRDYSEDFKKLSTKGVNAHIINADQRPTNVAHYDSLGFKTHIMKDTGHFLMVEKADEFNALLEGIVANK